MTPKINLYSGKYIHASHTHENTNSHLHEGKTQLQKMKKQTIPQSMQTIMYIIIRVYTFTADKPQTNPQAKPQTLVRALSVTLIRILLLYNTSRATETMT